MWEYCYSFLRVRPCLLEHLLSALASAPCAVCLQKRYIAEHSLPVSAGMESLVYSKWGSLKEREGYENRNGKEDTGVAVVFSCTKPCGEE